MRKIKVVVLLVQQLQHGFTKNAKVSPNLTVAHYIINNIGPRIEPCGTPTCIGKIVDVVSSISVYCFLLLR